MRRIILLLALVAAALVHAPRVADACGGCFAGSETVTSVDSHRMVVALSPDKTILWDQIRYTGSPQDFVWVLPVPSAAAQLGIADASFFDELDSQTAPQITGPTLTPPDCPPPPDGWGGGFQDAGASLSDAAVEVIKEETVGPYETVLLTSDDPNALIDWLIAHGYNVPDATRPTIAYYTDQQSLFYVLRLAPEQGVSAMQPVRVEYPGYMSTFPLRMVTAGAWGLLGLTVWVIAEQRFEARNYGTATIDRDQLVWDWSLGSSNYRDLFRQTIDANGGKAWIAEYAQPLSNLWFSEDEVQQASALLPYPFVTRLRTELLIDHVYGDLLLAPSPDAGGISNFIQVDASINEPPPIQCPDYDGDGDPDTWADQGSSSSWYFGCTTGGGAGVGAAVLLLLAGLAAIVMRRFTRGPR
jgi:hypothetical protein